MNKKTNQLNIVMLFSNINLVNILVSLTLCYNLCRQITINSKSLN